MIIVKGKSDDKGGGGERVLGELLCVAITICSELAKNPNQQPKKPHYLIFIFLNLNKKLYWQLPIWE